MLHFCIAHICYWLDGDTFQAKSKEGNRTLYAYSLINVNDIQVNEELISDALRVNNHTFLIDTDMFIYVLINKAINQYFWKDIIGYYISSSSIALLFTNNTIKRFDLEKNSTKTYFGNKQSKNYINFLQKVKDRLAITEYHIYVKDSKISYSLQYDYAQGCYTMIQKIENLAQTQRNYDDIMKTRDTQFRYHNLQEAQTNDELQEEIKRLYQLNYQLQRSIDHTNASNFQNLEKQLKEKQRMVYNLQKKISLAKYQLNQYQKMYGDHALQDQYVSQVVQKESLIGIQTAKIELLTMVGAGLMLGALNSVLLIIFKC